MGTSVVRYTTQSSTAQWGVLKEGSVYALAVDSDHHRDLIELYNNDRIAFDSAIKSEGVAADTVEFLSPISQRIQLYVQGMNYHSHRKEGGVFNEEDVDLEDDENLLFYKASSTISKPNETIVRPKTCELLDYEIELGFVLKADMLTETDVNDDNLGDYVGGFVLANDVSARDFMFGAPALQWFKGKSQRTFCPLGPVLYLLEGDDIKQIHAMELKLHLNGKLMQHGTTDQLIHKPAKTLRDLSEFSNLHTGDCILTGTPGGVLANFNLKTALAILFNMKNDRNRRKKFTQAQLAQTDFLKPGDVLELQIKSLDGSIDLGQQKNAIADA